MATVYTDAQRRAAYIKFEADADQPGPGGATSKARARAGKRFSSLAVGVRLHLGDAMLVLEHAERVVTDREGQVRGWDAGARAAPVPTTSDQRDAQQALMLAYKALQWRLVHLYTL